MKLLVELIYRARHAFYTTKISTIKFDTQEDMRIIPYLVCMRSILPCVSTSG